MIYFFYGDDREKTRAKWRATTQSFKNKYPAGMVFYFTAEDFNLTQFEELIFSNSLFSGGGAKRLVVADGLLASEVAAEFINKNLADLVASPNTFILLEARLPSDLVKKVQKLEGKLEEHKLALKSASPPFNIFAINDAFVNRDRKQLWIVYQKAIAANVPEEEIFWKLVWQVKTMLTVAKQKGEPKTLKPFVIGKARRGLTKFKVEELEQYSRDLVTLWHDTRRGLVDFDIGLEQLVLSV